MNHSLFNLDAYQYELPVDLIAQYPCMQRDHSRLLLVDRKAASFSEIKFYELSDFLQEKDQLIFNDTRVIPARLLGTREGGGKTEIFLVQQCAEANCWEVMARPGRKLKKGSCVQFAKDFTCEIVETLENGHKIVTFNSSDNFMEKLNQYGHLPLPHYIQRQAEEKEDQERYQTLFAKKLGAVAAPTAGLHFSQQLLENLDNKKVKRHFLTLHVGLGTFKPVQTEDIRSHAMHHESYFISEETAYHLNQPLSSTQKQICIGTTSCRALESACNKQGNVQAGNFTTDIFIYPGYSFKFVKALLTNFHLPRSSLLMLVSAFGGYELIREAYQKAIKDRFRFYSYGDAMLII